MSLSRQKRCVPCFRLTSSRASTFKNMSLAAFPLAYNAQFENGCTASSDEMLTIVSSGANASILLRALINPDLYASHSI